MDLHSPVGHWPNPHPQSHVLTATGVTTDVTPAFFNETSRFVAGTFRFAPAAPKRRISFCRHWEVRHDARSRSIRSKGCCCRRLSYWHLVAILASWLLLNRYYSCCIWKHLLIASWICVLCLIASWMCIWWLFFTSSSIWQHLLIASWICITWRFVCGACICKHILNGLWICSVAPPPRFVEWMLWLCSWPCFCPSSWPCPWRVLHAHEWAGRHHRWHAQLPISRRLCSSPLLSVQLPQGCDHAILRGMRQDALKPMMTMC